MTNEQMFARIERNLDQYWAHCREWLGSLDQDEYLRLAAMLRPRSSLRDFRLAILANEGRECEALRNLAAIAFAEGSVRLAAARDSEGKDNA